MVDRNDNGDADPPQDGIKKILFSAGFGTGDTAVAAQAQPSTLLMCVAADYGCEEARIGSRPLSDAADFADLMRRAAPEITIRVEDRIAGGDLDLTLRFEDIGDFTPDKLSQRIPSVAAALSAHVLLHTRAKGGIDGEHLRDGLAALDLPAALRDTLEDMSRATGGTASRPAPTSPATATTPATATNGDGDSELDRLLSMVDVPGSPTAAPDAGADDADKARAGLRAFISEVVGGGSGTAQDPQARAAARHLDRLIAEQIDAILTHEDFVALEGAWRGLHFLVRHSDFRAGVRLLPRLAHAGGDDSWPERLFAPLADGEAEPDVVVLATPMHNTDASVADLGRLAAAGEAHHVPVLCSLDAAFTGLAAKGLPAMSDPGLSMTGPAFESWNALRDRSSARWLVAAWNDPMVRHPWRPAEDKRLKLAGAGAVRDKGLRAPAAFAVAPMMAGSHARIGWPSEIVGRDARLEGLETEEITLDHGEAVAIPFAFPVTSDVAHSMADAGILALACRYNRDTATLVAAPTVHRPGRFQDDPDGAAARRLSSLPYQMVVSRIVRALHDAPFGDQATAGQVARAALEPVLASSGPGAFLNVSVIPDPDEPGGELLEIEARTGGAVGGGLTVFLDLPI